jgi:hypothetical protein
MYCIALRSCCRKVQSLLATFDCQGAFTAIYSAPVTWTHGIYIHSFLTFLPFQFADVNAFLTFAATRHTFSPLHLEKNPKVARIVEAGLLKLYSELQC